VCKIITMNDKEQLLAVVKDHSIVLFIGTRKQCYCYMKTHCKWDDLRYVTPENTLGRMSSWILN